MTSEIAGILSTARALVAGDKGILAMDESNGTCNARFAPLGIPQNEDSRRAYRELSPREMQQGRAAWRVRRRSGGKVSHRYPTSALEISLPPRTKRSIVGPMAASGKT
jgi:hypothetical protein